VHVKIEAWRRNGKTKTWKTRPGQFQIPVKHGLYDYAYITQDDGHCHVASECPAVDQYGSVRENPGYQPKTGERCTCRPGIERDNCPVCEGTGWRIDFPAIRAIRSDEDGPRPNPCGTGYHMNAGAKLRAPVHDYASAAAFLGRRSERTLANNTVVRYDWRDPNASVIDVVLHHTPIVRFHPDGNVELNSGNYRTVTTKARINEVLFPLGYRIVQEHYDWFLFNWRSGESVDFFDGMVIRGSGV
jgi:hypothetical protein